MRLHFTTPEKSEEEKEQAQKDEFMKVPITMWVVLSTLFFIALALCGAPSPAF